jgi:uncharacterized protein
MTAATLHPDMAEATERRVWNLVLLGGSGQLGTVLARHFHGAGHSVTVVSRKCFSRNPGDAAWKTASWDGQNLGEWVNPIGRADVVINLAGRNVNCRYGSRNRARILGSRLQSTELVGKAIAAAKAPPAVWLNASTATIYRHALDRAMDEETGELGGEEKNVPHTWSFSMDVAKRWEACFFAAKTPGTRKVALRSAMTMSPDPGGIFDTLLRLVRLGLGGTAASGEQFISWIHELDFVRAVEFLIAEEAFEGVVNLAAPHPLPNAKFMKVLRDAWGTRLGLPAMRWMLETGAFLIRTETELILKSRRVVPARLLSAGFEFVFPTWHEAARDLVEKWRMQGNHKGELQ